MQFILDYNILCMRDDVFAVLSLIYDAQSEEEYLEKVKRFIAYVKLVAPEIINLYEIENRITSARGLFRSEYYLHVPLRDLVGKKDELVRAVAEYY